MKSEKNEKLNMQLEKGISIPEKKSGAMGCPGNECVCRTLEYDFKITKFIFGSILFTTHVAALICLVITFSGEKVRDDRLVDMQSDLEAVQVQCDSALRLMRYKLRHLENVIDNKLEEANIHVKSLSYNDLEQHDTTIENNEDPSISTSDIINQINMTDDNEYFSVNLNRSFINVTDNFVDSDDSELSPEQLCAKLLTSNLQDHEEYSRLCKDVDIRSSRVKRSNMRGPVASHFKGGVPETYIRDGGLVAPWYPDEKASAAFTLKYEFREGKGTIEVTDGGLYLIYAQVYYLTTESLNTYVINVREKDASVKPIAYCSSNAVIPEGGVSEVSCYTAVIRYLNATNQVYITQRDRNRRMILRDGHSFLGLICLNSEAEHKRRRNDRSRN